MNFSCKALAGLLLVFALSPKGAAPIATEVLGILNHDIDLDIPDFQNKDKIVDIQWEKMGRKIARHLNGKIVYQKPYQLSKNGSTLKIKHLERNDSGSYKADLYNESGHNVLTQTFDLKILERVSKPVMNWTCAKGTMSCTVAQGTDPKLTLYLNGGKTKEGQKVITYKWINNTDSSFICIATNRVSEEISKVDILCSEKRLDIPLIIGICGGGVLLFLFVALLILFISKRKKQHRTRNDKEVEFRTHRMTSEERSWRPYQTSASAPQTPAMSQAPPPPGHRPQAHGPHPPHPGHRVQQQQQKKPLPGPGTQAYQQKGPPLPRPRVQPKPPRGARGNS